MRSAIEATFLYQSALPHTRGLTFGRTLTPRVGPRFRLIHSARVVESKICYDIKDANQIYELFYTRFSLHKRIYNHKTSVSFSFFFLSSFMEMGRT